MSAAYQVEQPAPAPWPVDAIYKPHPHADLFPLIEGDAYWALVADIKLHGIREPVVLLGDLILDGRNRYLAARECGASIPTVQFDGPDPLAFVVSLNLTRRHLTESQRALVATRLAKMPRGRPQNNSAIAPISQAKAADLLNVSVDNIKRARIVDEHGAPGLIAGVEAGQFAISAAAEVARLPEPEQTALVAAGPGAIRDAAAVQRSDLCDADKAEQRAVIIAGALRAGRGGPTGSRRNPNHVPNPAFDAIAMVSGRAGDIADRLIERGAAFILSGAVDQAMRLRCLDRMRAGRDALTEILEHADAK